MRILVIRINTANFMNNSLIFFDSVNMFALLSKFLFCNLYVVEKYKMLQKIKKSSYKTIRGLT